MAQTLESMKGKGGSIKLGTTGTISSLMTRELDHISSVPHKQQVSSTNKPRTRTLPVSVPCSSSSSSSSTTTSATPKRLQPRKSSDEASSSGNSKNTNRRSLGNGISQKTKASGRTRNTTHRMPMLSSDSNFSVDRTPIKEKIDKKKLNIVEVVDIKCGNAEKAWATPLTSRLKKLGFSKLSESII